VVELDDLGTDGGLSLRPVKAIRPAWVVVHAVRYVAQGKTTNERGMRLLTKANVRNSRMQVSVVEELRLCMMLHLHVKQPPRCGAQPVDLRACCSQDTLKAQIGWAC
jgi:hypothetical protein